MTADISNKLRILVADDHRMILEMFSMYLSNIADMSVTTAETFDEAAQIIQNDGPFDVVLLDLNMPGMNGVTGLRRGIRLNGGKPVAIITGSPTPKMQEEIMNSGAAGIILKTTPARSLANAIRFIQSGEIYMPMELMRAQAEPNRTAKHGQLSEKEAQVLNFLAEGKPNKAIANELQLAEPTVKMHVTAICRKLGASNRTQAVIMARDMGIV
ncbi:response regulator transcription factor [Pseudotabrizicola algicola]|uniref:Response regulator transcription factor n=1 Tax=Pseudotabrizicola algicola TaxID=2709381 RepID=A0A6B3RIJ7_9RHOB|nr:response regulator transcription factor [Pseudotabrizicola algicola]NEX45241.1 response regulator transcription factor [Pseudotabrizicola algicola]